MHTSAMLAFNFRHRNSGTSTAVEVGVPKLGNCLEIYTCPSQCLICAQHVYQLGHSLYTEATAWPPLVHWSCIHACAQAWARVHFQAVSKLGHSNFYSSVGRSGAMLPQENVLSCRMLIHGGNFQAKFH